MSGRAATIRTLPGKYALAVGRPALPTPKGWAWVPLTDVARLESGHTPSRSHPEYWNGPFPWVGIVDARDNHAREITHTVQTITQAGLANSSARMLPAGTVCLVRTAGSIGHVTVLGRSMATSQDLVDWVCGPRLEPWFLAYLFVAEKESLRSFSRGSAHPTVYFPEVKAFHVCLPPVAEQRRIVAKLEALRARSRGAREALDAVPLLLEKLRRSVLAAAFRGDLTKHWRARNKNVEPASVTMSRHPLPEHRQSGRGAAINVRPGRCAISIGNPETDVPDGWCWTLLSRLARMESGHTPSRAVEKYWGGDVPWVSIPDARDHNGRVIEATTSTITEAGLANSAARLLPPRTVCLVRTAASIGYVTILGREMATSQDFANWVCGEALVPKYLMYALWAEREAIRSFGEGSAHPTVYFPELKAFHLKLAPLEEQHVIVDLIERRLASLGRLRTSFEELADKHGKLEPSMFAKAFRGELVPQDPNDESVAAVLARASGENGATSNDRAPNGSSARVPTRSRRRRDGRGAVEEA